MTVLNTNKLQTNLTRSRYQRISPLYDRMEIMSEGQFSLWRRKIWSEVRGPKILEVGVGTGKNMPYYPSGMQITAIDLTPGMLDRAWIRAANLNQDVDLLLGDVQRLKFRDDSFDSAVATCVFCSVPDPILGLRELNRVVKPGGWILLLEHVRIDHPIIGRVMDFLNPLVVRIAGANINRHTVEAVKLAGLKTESIEHLGPMKMVKLIVARPSKE